MLQRIDYASLARDLIEAGDTTRALGKKLGLSQPAVSRLACGHTRRISADAAIALIRLAGGTVVVPERVKRAEENLAG